MYICISIGLRVVHLKDIKTYFLNKNYDFKNSLCQTCPDIECLFTEGNFNFPEETTICARWWRLAMLFMPSAHETEQSLWRSKTFLWRCFYFRENLRKRQNVFPNSTYRQMISTLVFFNPGQSQRVMSWQVRHGPASLVLEWWRGKNRYSMR